MAQAAKLQLRQTQKLALTPQLVQSIQLLQMNATQLQAWVAQEVEKNPILEIDASTDEFPVERRGSAGGDNVKPQENAPDGARDEPDAIDRTKWENDASSDQQTLIHDNVFGDSADLGNRSAPSSDKINAPSGDIGEGSRSALDLEAIVAEQTSMVEALGRQASLTFKTSADLRVAGEIIQSLDEDGYLRREIDDIADATASAHDHVAAVLSKIQTFEPAGIAARSLSQCMQIQLAEKNRLDPAMDTMVRNLPLLARRDFAQLQALCGVDQDDLNDMVREIQLLDPKPGLQFQTKITQNVTPDVYVTERSDGGWHVELNSAVLPKVLINREYYADIKQLGLGKTDREFMVDQLQNANWLVASLDQRAQTILKVTTEIVRQQDGFFANGAEHLRPLNLRKIAEEIEMHESTVSRVTSNKFLMCRAGVFELKYFLNSHISGNGSDDDGIGGKAVQAKIKRFIDAESVNNILSDEKIVAALADEGISLARRTVTKYREALGILSSVERRREKRALASSKSKH